MAKSSISAKFNCEIEKIWEIVTRVEEYSEWRSDLSMVEVIGDNQFIEYTKNGYSTRFMVTYMKPFERWEFDMDNTNMSGHWTGVFKYEGNGTVIDFTEEIFVKKVLMKPFAKAFLKKQQEQFVNDLRENI